jgi:TM2 domain-containing membrane protein YozV
MPALSNCRVPPRPRLTPGIVADDAAGCGRGLPENSDHGEAMSEHQPPPSYPVQPSMGYPMQQVAPKSPGIALLASFFIPGLGSLMNGDVGKGIAIFIGYVVSLFLVLILIGIFGMFGFWVWGMVDAYQGARRWNARHGIIS